MATVSKGGRFRQAGIPAAIAKEAVRIVQEHPELGFRTLSEFARTAMITQLRHVHTQLALNAIWATTALGAEAVDALLRESLPSDYRAILDASNEARQRVCKITDSATQPC